MVTFGNTGVREFNGFNDLQFCRQPIQFLQLAKNSNDRFKAGSACFFGLKGTSFPVSPDSDGEGIDPDRLSSKLK
ncbi:MAG: hypothetical protein ACK5WZ_01175 [Pseudobdellovibrionaceae bacterium]